MRPCTQLPVIDVTCMPCLGLIVLRSSGVAYSLGFDWEEGVMVPIDDPGDHTTDALTAFLADYEGGTMPESTAEPLDRILRSPAKGFVVSGTFFLEVDRARLKDSYQSWLYVTVRACPDEAMVSYERWPGGGYSSVYTLSGRSNWNPSKQPELEADANLYPLFGFGRARGVLTW